MLVNDSKQDESQFGSEKTSPSPKSQLNQTPAPRKHHILHNDDEQMISHCSTDGQEEKK